MEQIPTSQTTSPSLDADKSNIDNCLRLPFLVNYNGYANYFIGFQYSYPQMDGREKIQPFRFLPLSVPLIHPSERKQVPLN